MVLLTVASSTKPVFYCICRKVSDAGLVWVWPCSPWGCSRQSCRDHCRVLAEVQVCSGKGRLPKVTLCKIYCGLKIIVLSSLQTLSCLLKNNSYNIISQLRYIYVVVLKLRNIGLAHYLNGWPPVNRACCRFFLFLSFFSSLKVKCVNAIHFSSQFQTS